MSKIKTTQLLSFQNVYVYKSTLPKSAYPENVSDYPGWDEKEQNKIATFIF